jgi:hypothetical protein
MPQKLQFTSMKLLDIGKVEYLENSFHKQYLATNPCLKKLQSKLVYEGIRLYFKI